MKNSFSYCQSIEKEGYEEVKYWLETKDYSCTWTDSENDRGKYGDFFVEKEDEKFSIELKVETSNEYGNLFLEYWSNFNPSEPQFTNPGWLTKATTAKYLFYYFIKEKELIIINWQELLRWAFLNYSNVPLSDGTRLSGNIHRFPLKVQHKYEGLNYTWGYTVPIELLMKELGGAIRHIDINPRTDD